MRRSPLLAAALAIAAALGLACGPPKTPADEDACTSDRDCGGALVCCHTTGETPSTEAPITHDRGFCVKRDVCAGVPIPPAAPPPED